MIWRASSGLKEPCKFVTAGALAVPYAVQRGIMQGSLDKEVVSVHPQGQISRVYVHKQVLCVQTESEMCYILMFFPTAVKPLAHFFPMHGRRPLSDPDLSCNAQ